MKKWPTWLKYLIVALVLVLNVCLLYYMNMRNGQVEMPLPDWFTTLARLCV